MADDLEVRRERGYEEEGENTWMRIKSAPASARPIAISAPIPLVPPVMKAVFPFRENISRTGVLML